MKSAKLICCADVYNIIIISLFRAVFNAQYLHYPYIVPCEHHSAFFEYFISKKLNPYARLENHACTRFLNTKNVGCMVIYGCYHNKVVLFLLDNNDSSLGQH